MANTLPYPDIVVLRTIFLHSCGPIREHTKASGEIVYYRDV